MKLARRFCRLLGPANSIHRRSARAWVKEHQGKAAIREALQPYSEDPPSSQK
jgi:hypothetical protein